MRGFWLKENDKIVGNSILKLVEYIETEILIDNLPEYKSVNLLNATKNIGIKLLGEDIKPVDLLSKASFSNGSINISLQNDMFDHFQKLLKDEHYYNAVEESYKIVRKKLKEITGEEKANLAFSAKNIKLIFGHEATNESEKNFFEGVKFLHMAIQFLRNEKAHTPAKSMNKNLAIHYISLASLAYDLISRNNT